MNPIRKPSVIDPNLPPKTEHVKVYLRLRPDQIIADRQISDQEQGQEQDYSDSSIRPGATVRSRRISIELQHDDTVTIRATSSPSNESYTSTFTRCFAARAAQEEVYNVVAAPVVSSVLEGYNGTVFAYGHTGTGKTYTMFGPVSVFTLDSKAIRLVDAIMLDTKEQESEETRGIVPRSLAQIFEEVERVEAEEEVEFQVFTSYVQLYCEVIYDLIQPSNESLLLRESKDKGVFVENATRVEIRNLDEAMHLIREASKHRALASTNLNETSSRSHTCLMIDVLKRPVPSCSNHTSSTPAEVPKAQVSKLVLVDLAGSERVSQALGSEQHYLGPRFKESRAINLSLSSLGNCINALATGKKHVPFRDSKLTRLLRDALGGNCKTSLIMNTYSRLSLAEARSSLQFGERAMNVQSTPVINQEVDFKALYLEIQEKMDQNETKIQSLQLKLEEKRTELASIQQTSGLKLDPGNGGLQTQQRNVQERTTQTALERIASSFSPQNVSTSVAATASTPSVRGDIVVSLTKTEQDENLRAECEKLNKDFAEERKRLTERLQRLEDELQSEKEEHLVTCRRLSAKQAQLLSATDTHSTEETKLLGKITQLEKSNTVLEARLRAAESSESVWKSRAKALESQKPSTPTQHDEHAYNKREQELIAELTKRVSALESKKQQRCLSREERQDSPNRSRFNSKLQKAKAARSEQSPRVFHRNLNNAPEVRSRHLTSVAADILGHN